MDSTETVWTTSSPLPFKVSTTDGGTSDGGQQLNLTAEHAMDWYGCTNASNDERKVLEAFNVWFGGGLSLAIAIPGFFGNIGAAYVLSQKGIHRTQSVLFKRHTATVHKRSNL